MRMIQNSVDAQDKILCCSFWLCNSHLYLSALSSMKVAGR